MNDGNCNYGNRADQIHEFFKAKREWSKVKDEILGKYIACYLKTIQHRGRPIIIIDAFSGPGSFGDGSDGSPLITCKTIEKVRHGVGIGCIFSDLLQSLWLLSLLLCYLCCYVFIQTQVIYDVFNTMLPVTNVLNW